MRTLHDKQVRLAPWMGCTPPRIEQTAYLEHAMDLARSWVRHGKREMQVWRARRQSPFMLGVQAD